MGEWQPYAAIFGVWVLLIVFFKGAKDEQNIDREKSKDSFPDA